MAGYQSLFSGRASANTATEKTGKQGYTSVFGTATIQQASDDEIKQQRQQQAKDAAAKQKSDADAAAKAAQDRANNSIFGKVKTAAKSMATDIVHTGEKTANGLIAGEGGVTGALVAGAQAVTGHKDAAAKTVAGTNKMVDKFLDHGIGNQGSYLKSDQAAMTDMPKPKSNSILDRAKAAGQSTVNDYIKPVAKASADIAPYVTPAGRVAEGGSLLARAALKVSPELEGLVRSEKFLPGAARAAVGNAAVGAGTDATNQLIDSGHVNLKQTGQAALEGGVFGAAMHGVEHGGASLFSKVRQNTLPDHVAQAHIDATAAAAPDAMPGLPRPGEVIAPQPATARAEMLQEKPAIVPSNPSVPLAHNGAIQPQPTLPFDHPVEGQLPIDAAASATAGKPVPVAKEPAQAPIATTPEVVPEKIAPSVNDTPKPVEVAPKPEPIDGYAHSDHLRKDFAEGMREMDKGQGGNKYHVHDSGMPDTGEKSPFYRQFFKENGKAPTKADYDAEAHRVLSTGKAGDDHATEVYKQLLEREGKTAPEPKAEAPKTEAPKVDSPAPKPEAKAEPTPVKAPTPPAEKPAGEGTDKGISRTAASVQQKALEKGLEKDYGQLAEYDKTTIKKQAEQATELLHGPRDDIEAILAGEKPLPDGLKASTFIKAIEEHPEYSHDPDMLRDLGRSDIHKQISTAAQELRLSRERNPNSSVEAIRQIDQIRKAAFKEKYGKTAEKAQSEEVKAIQQAQPKLDTSDWSSFIDSIRC